LTVTLSPFRPVFDDPAAAQDFETELRRASAYAYYHLRVMDPVLLIGGVAYDHLRYPEKRESPAAAGRGDYPRAGLAESRSGLDTAGFDKFARGLRAFAWRRLLR
jgi:hypothetical protein